MKFYRLTFIILIFFCFVNIMIHLLTLSLTSGFEKIRRSYMFVIVHHSSGCFFTVFLFPFNFCPSTFECLFFLFSSSKKKKSLFNENDEMHVFYQIYFTSVGNDDQKKNNYLVNLLIQTDSYMKERKTNMRFEHTKRRKLIVILLQT